MLSPHAIAGIRLLILLGTRLREVLHLRWTEVDLSAGCLASRQQDRRKTIILNAPALAVLQNIPRVGAAVLAIPIGSMLAWKRGDLAGVTMRLLAAVGVTLLAALVWLAMHDFKASLAVLGIALGVWVIVGSLNELALRLGVGWPLDLSRVLGRARGLPRSAWAMTAAHAGVGRAHPRHHGAERRPGRAYSGDEARRYGRPRRLRGEAGRRGAGAGPELHGPARHL